MLRRLANRLIPACLATTVTLTIITTSTPRAFAADLKVLFLGDPGHHRPADRFRQIQPVLAGRGIEMTYTERMSDLNVDRLRQYDALVVYANIDRIEPDQAQALLDYVDGGGGFVPLHCASYCFRNDDRIVALIGAQFLRHETGTFRTQIVEPDHPVMRGFAGFESWDETYVHHLHNERDRTVLSYRVDGSGREPWTWVRTHGKGRVFYTAWGHDHRTWGHEGFQNLLERGIRWAANEDVAVVPVFMKDQSFPIPRMQDPRTDVEPFQYVDVGGKIPNYTPSGQPGGMGEAISKMQMPLTPNESQKHWVLPEGFRLELFVSEPDLGGKPICMTWDERGRLWVSETYDYPNELQPPGQGRDRIRICEDTDGDWRADKFTVFAEGLSIPTSITFSRGCVIVQNGTQTISLRDTNGDDVADEQTVLFTGWNQADTHGGVSNFQYGFDNWIWAMQGYNSSQPVPASGVRSEASPRFANGFFRFRPDTSEVEFIRSTNNNTWGLGFSEEGIVFGSTANRNPSVYMPIPNRYYESVQGWTPSLVLGTIADTHLFKPITEKVRQVDHHGGYTAAAGHALYTARNYPREYWNRVAFVNGPTGHLVGLFVLKPSGADFSSTSPFSFLASDDEWSAPIMSEIGPDGNLWVIDWYNYIVQHNPTPRGFETGKGNAYETDLRDKKHGRIYRVVYESAERSEPISLAAAGPSELVATLRSQNLFWRRHAQRLLVERGELDVVPQLIDMVRDPSVDEIGLNTGAIHALHTLHGLGVLDGQHADANEAVATALTHPSAGVRRNALQVLPPRQESVDLVLDSGLLNDRDGQVRLAALLAIADLPARDQRVGDALLTSAVDPSVHADRWLSDASTIASAMHADLFLTAVAKLDRPTDELRDLLSVVAQHYARSSPLETVSSLMARLSAADPGVAGAVVAGLASGWPAGRPPVLDDQLERSLDRLFERLDVNDRGQLLKLGSQWGSSGMEKHAERIVGALVARLDDAAASDAERIDAARNWLALDPSSDETTLEILSRITPQMAPLLASEFIDLLRASESSQIGEALVERLAQWSPQVRQAAIRVLLARRNATEALLDGLDSGDVQLLELSLDQRQSLARHPDREVRRRTEELLRRGGALPNADRQLVLDELLEITRTSGDPVAGKEAFTKVCAKCHRHGGEGAEVGPDLTGMSVHPKDELLTHIIDPNRSVESNYRTYNVVTLDGRVLNGLVASESRTAIELFDAEGKKTTILREEIEELIGSKNSLMPEGFEKQLSRPELTDLLEYLTQRGVFHPLDLGDAATIASDRGMFNGSEVMLFDDWDRKTFLGVPFELIKPQDGSRKNIILLNGPMGRISAQMPSAAEVKVGRTIRSLHLLSGVSGWGYPAIADPSVSLIVRFHYRSGESEDHRLQNAIHFADYIRRVDVPKSVFAFALGSQQVRYLSVHPTRREPVERIEFLKGDDDTAPIVMAATIEE